MRNRTFFFLLALLFLTTSVLYAEVILEVYKGGVGHEDDAELSWSPGDPQDVLYQFIGNPFNILVSNATPCEFHSGALIGGIDYCYKVVEPDSSYQAGDLYSIDDIVGGMRYIPSNAPSGFTQGSPSTECRDIDEGPQFTHTLTRNIAVMETEVTRQMWADLYAVQLTLPSDPSDPTYSPGMSHPVNRVTWYEAVLFANLLSIQNMFGLCYYKDDAFTIPVDSTNYTSGTFYCNFDATGYRLLSEGEWEYVARAGTTGPFSCAEDNYTTATCYSPYCVADEFPVLEQYAVFCANDPGTSEPVGSKLANPWNLLDMHGNVWEWCGDWRSVTYPGDSTDYVGPGSAYTRVVRGGNWENIAKNCRSGKRGGCEPGYRSICIGFRLARSVH